ncbi:hypothetical protein [Lysobacter enzymogenes]|jgi:hypothetical protein|uniref:hypothetical protein n=1 Tax=Lysobacter enzymogenes TaxID=69 RepID=UPI000894DE2C|nr:hypothetical protein [Lysobacter enzymogenes]SDW59743.1 hypothetical protein SAMN05421681_102306 [Lysobacter enzymogenes]
MSLMSIAVPARQRAGAFFAALRAFALTAALLFSAGVQADPVRAEQLMQVVRTQRAVLDSHMVYVNMYLNAGNVEAAQFSLSMAYSEAIAINAKMVQLGNELRNSREAGQYTDLQALERAISYCTVARQRMQMIQSYLLTLQMERPPSQITRTLLDMQFQLYEAKMRELERAMSEA